MPRSLRDRSRLPLATSGGFSFIEVLVALAVTVIVMGVLFGLLAQGSGASTAEFDRTDLQAQARAALQMISQDVLMAGGNLPPEFPSLRAGVSGIRHVEGLEIVGDFDNHAGGAGAFSVVRFDGRFAELGSDPTRFRRGDLVLCYDDEPTNGKWMFGLVETVVAGSRPELVLLTEPGSRLDDVTPPIALPGNVHSYNRPLPESGFITPVSVIGYGVEPDLEAPDLVRSSLWRRVNWGEPLEVAFIEDLEIQYFVGGTVVDPAAPANKDQVGPGPKIFEQGLTGNQGAAGSRAGGEWETDSPPPPQPTPSRSISADGLIQGVRITVTARSRMPNLRGSRVEEGRDPSEEGFIRETLSTRVAPRNLLIQAERRKLQIDAEARDPS